MERINGQIATEATLIQLAVSSVLSKKAGEAFKKTINSLQKG